MSPAPVLMFSTIDYLGCLIDRFASQRELLAVINAGAASVQEHWEDTAKTLARSLPTPAVLIVPKLGSRDAANVAARVAVHFGLRQYGEVDGWPLYTADLAVQP